VSYYGAGDYYGAGGLGSFLGSIGKGIVGAAGGFLTGGPLGAIKGATAGFGGNPLGVPPSYPGPTAPQQLPVLVPQPGLGGAIARALPGGSTGMVARDVPPRGYHLNKSGYFLKSGEFVAPHSRYVRNRSRNNANGRALRRAVGRVRGFERLVHRSRKSLRALSKI